MRRATASRSSTAYSMSACSATGSAPSVRPCRAGLDVGVRDLHPGGEIGRREARELDLAPFEPGVERGLGDSGRRRRAAGDAGRHLAARCPGAGEPRIARASGPGRAAPRCSAAGRAGRRACARRRRRSCSSWRARRWSGRDMLVCAASTTPRCMMGHLGGGAARLVGLGGRSSLGFSARRCSTSRRCAWSSSWRVMALPPTSATLSAPSRKLL